MKKLIGVLCLVSVACFNPLAYANSVNGKYSGLVQTLNCPQDKAKYGDFSDYGYWKGGPWCGQTGKAGYWVWQAPNWYVWANKSGKRSLPQSNSVNGKYSGLVQTLNCPQDKAKYGDFSDYGYWKGGPWCGQTGKAGYWVWQAPNWYVWANKNRQGKRAVAPTDSASANGKYSGLIQTLPCPQDQAKYGLFKDYGHWKGGPWCGQTGQAGYWVWSAPNWYVWASKGQQVSPSASSANGKYSGLVQTLPCPGDQAKYGNFKDYGYWKGGLWCGQNGQAGYWVWQTPNWYVWREQR